MARLVSAGLLWWRAGHASHHGVQGRAGPHGRHEGKHLQWPRTRAGGKNQQWTTHRLRAWAKT
eukprot:203651-Pyramimonas_sp.AAC.1